MVFVQVMVTALITLCCSVPVVQVTISTQVLVAALLLACSIAAIKVLDPVEGGFLARNASNSNLFTTLSSRAVQQDDDGGDEWRVKNVTSVV